MLSAENAGERVGGAAGREGHDHADRLRGISCLREYRRIQRNERRCDQNAATNIAHHACFRCWFLTRSSGAAVAARLELVCSVARLCGNLLVRKLWRTGALRGMLNCNGANVTLGIHIKNGVLIEVAGLDNRSISELDKQSIGVSEVTNFHGVNLLSKKALCTVSPSGKRTTRRNRFSISGTCTQRRIRPSAWTISRRGIRIARSIHSSRIIARSGRLRTASK